jgi:hypothetical protein
VGFRLSLSLSILLHTQRLCRMTRAASGDPVQAPKQGHGIIQVCSPRSMVSPNYLVVQAQANT